MAGVDWSALRARLEQYGQGHLLQFLEELTEAQREELHSDISEVDLGRVTGYFRVCAHCHSYYYHYSWGSYVSTYTQFVVLLLEYCHT